MNVEFRTRTKAFRAYSLKEKTMRYSNGDISENSLLFNWIATHDPKEIVIMDNIGIIASRTGQSVYEFDIVECDLSTNFGKIPVRAVVSFDQKLCGWKCIMGIDFTKSTNSLVITKVIGNAVADSQYLQEIFHNEKYDID